MLLIRGQYRPALRVVRSPTGVGRWRVFEVTDALAPRSTAVPHPGAPGDWRTRCSHGRESWLPDRDTVVTLDGDGLLRIGRSPLNVVFDLVLVDRVDHDLVREAAHGKLVGLN